MRHGVVELRDGRRAVLVGAEPRHAEAVHALRQGVLAEGRYFLSVPDHSAEALSRTRHAIYEHGADPHSLYLLARSQGVVLGVLTLSCPPVPRLRHLVRLEVFLAADARGQGLGRGLVQSGITWAIAHPRIHKLSLAVMADNVRALSLYTSLDFQEEGRRIGEVREADGTLRDDVLMARRV